MNRGAWKRFTTITKEWKGRQLGICKVATEHADRGPSSSFALWVRRLLGERREGEGIDALASSFQDDLRSYGRNVASFGQPCLLPASMRHYAAPLSRNGRSAQKPARLPQDPNAPPEPEKPSRKINRAIVSRTVRLIIDDGESHEILTRGEALKRAEQMDLDLVEVDGKQDPPVCKLMDYNKQRYKDKQREKDLKKKQSERRRLDDLKEVRFSTRTEHNDLELKAQMALRLLTKGHRVKLAVIPHGNDELERKGRELLEQMGTLLQDSSKVEIAPRIERQRAWMLVRPSSVVIQNGPKKKREGLDKVERSSGSSDTEGDEIPS